MARVTLLERVTDFIKVWDLPVDETLAMMRRRHTILSGSVALATVEPGPWFPQDLDFYCPSSQFQAIADWFTLHGYTIIDDVDSTYVPSLLTRDDLDFPPEDAHLYWDFPRVRVGISNCIRRVITMCNVKDLEIGAPVKSIPSASHSIRIRTPKRTPD